MSKDTLKGSEFLKKYEYAWSKYTDDDKDKVWKYAEEYRQFLSAGKTEREIVACLIDMAKIKGYVDLKDLITAGAKLKAGDKVYAVHKERLLALFTIGTKPMADGMNIIGAHADSPRLDLKQNPLYEDNGFAMMKTHYYGGVKKYQWVTMPLALHGLIVKKDGTKIYINIGEDAGDPVVGISDLLPHLAKDQMKKDLATGIEGENLNICVGSIPIDDKDDSVKRNILKLLNKKYGIDEGDFVSAELEAVPAGQARSYGLDDSMIMGYGHDDRACCYTAVTSLFDAAAPCKTCVALVVDKEEVGSMGSTGMESKFFENTVAEIMAMAGQLDHLSLRRCLQNSAMLSGDVSAAFDPNFPDVVEKRNTAFLSKGISFNKYTGTRGKSGSSDADPEFIAKICRIMDENKVSWQTSELGKVDQGGGGTIAYIMADYGMDVLDAGVPVHSMHAPWEIISKADLYETMKGYLAFFINA